MAKQDKTAQKSPDETPEMDSQTGAVVGAFDSESPEYTAITEAIGTGARVATQKPLEVIAAAIKANAGVGALPVAIAGVGVVMASDVTADSLADVEPGALGYMVSTIGCRGIESADGKKRNGIIGVSIYPAHSVSDILESADGQEYLQRLAEKEMAHIAYRGLLLSPGESIDEMNAVAQGMPRSVTDFTLRTRTGAGGGAFAVFNANWVSFKKLLESKPQTAKVAKMLPAKADMLKAIRSKSFAEARTPELESYGHIVKIAQLFQAALERVIERDREAGEDVSIEGDPTLIASWLESRDQLDLAGAVDEASLEDVDFSAFEV